MAALQHVEEQRHLTGLIERQIDSSPGSELSLAGQCMHVGIKFIHKYLLVTLPMNRLAHEHVAEERHQQLGFGIRVGPNDYSYYKLFAIIRNASIFSIFVFGVNAMKQTIRTSSQLGMLIQAQRKSKGLSQAALGVKMGGSQARQSALELKPERITLERLLRTLAALDLELIIQDRGTAQKTKSEW